MKRTPLRRKTCLKRKSAIKSGKPIARKTRLKGESAKHRKGRVAFHEAVFAAWGTTCFFCRVAPATQAMHVVDRKRLGGAQRYGCPVDNGRPGCEACHQRQTDRMIDFPLDVRQRAVLSLNALGKSALPYPQE